MGTENEEETGGDNDVVRPANLLQRFRLWFRQKRGKIQPNNGDEQPRPSSTKTMEMGLVTSTGNGDDSSGQQQDEQHQLRQGDALPSGDDVDVPAAGKAESEGRDGAGEASGSDRQLRVENGVEVNVAAGKDGGSLADRGDKSRHHHQQQRGTGNNVPTVSGACCLSIQRPRVVAGEAPGGERYQLPAASAPPRGKESSPPCAGSPKSGKSPTGDIKQQRPETRGNSGNGDHKEEEEEGPGSIYVDADLTSPYVIDVLRRALVFIWPEGDAESKYFDGEEAVEALRSYKYMMIHHGQCVPADRRRQVLEKIAEVYEKLDVRDEFDRSEYVV